MVVGRMREASGYRHTNVSNVVRYFFEFHISRHLSPFKSLLEFFVCFPVTAEGRGPQTVTSGPNPAHCLFLNSLRA